jgi:hypothetical protein
MHHKEGEEHAMAQFGFSRHSGSISAYLYYIEVPHKLCNAIDWKSNGTEGFPAHTNGMKPPYIIMAKSGVCSPVTKARHAQLDGAAAFIMAHDGCRCSDKNCTDKFGPDCIKEDEEIMVNDGSGADVSIPSFLLYKIVANSLIDKLKHNQPVLMELTWGLNDPVAGSAVHFSLWTTAHDPVLDLQTYQHFRQIAAALAPKALFEPRFSLIDGSRFKCDQQVDTNGPCDHLCGSKGRYCALHAWDLSGHAVVNETLRRLCIWKHYGAVESTSMVYWDYVIYHKEHCGGPMLYANNDCINDALRDAKADRSVVDQCYSDSGGLDEDAPNSLLQDMLVKQAQSGVLALPALTIGNHILDDPSSWNLFEGLCRHFWSTNLTATPDVCFKCASCANVIGCLEQGHCVDFQKPEENPSKGGGSDKKKKAHHGWTFFWIFFVLCGVGGGWYYYKKQQDTGFGSGGGVLNSYFQLPGDE